MPLTIEQVRKLLKKLKGKRSCGLDTICGFSLKIASELLLNELKHLINLSISTGQFCKEWKKTKIVPIWKNKGSRFDRQFYRPVANLSEVSKLCEMAIYGQVYDYFCTNGLLNKNHHGFLRNRSTVTAIQQLRDFWMKQIDKGRLCSALLLDLRAGFDVINLKLLREKLRIYGFDQLSLQWFESYLSGRSQCVQIESRNSSFLETPWGVPQGSQISPLLFTIFIMELPEVIVETDNDTEDESHEEEDTLGEETDEDSMIVIYADDNTPTCAAENLDSLQEKTERLAGNAVKWFDNNDMIVSSEKTKLLVMGTQRNRRMKIPENTIPKVNVNNEDISSSPSEKLLGLIIDENAGWKTHFYSDENYKSLLRILGQRVGILSKIRKFSTARHFIPFFHGIFMSNYCLGQRKRHTRAARNSKKWSH